MTLASTLVQAAFREGNLIDAEAVPTDAELAEGLAKLNRYIHGVFGYEMGEPLQDWLIPAPQRTASVAANFPQMPFPLDASGVMLGSPYATDSSAMIYRYPPKNTRIVWGQKNETAWFPEAPDDGTRMGFFVASGEKTGDGPDATLVIDGNGRLIDGAETVTLTVTSAPQEWLYRGDTGRWTTIKDMLLTDQCPFPPELDDLWVCALAIRMAPSFEKKVHPVTQVMFTAMLKKLQARYRQAGTTTYGSGSTPRSLQSTAAGRWWS
jgi:hypothetical protein